MVVNKDGNGINPFTPLKGSDMEFTVFSRDHR